MRNKFFGNGEIHPGQKRVIHKVAAHVSPPPAAKIEEPLGELLGEEVSVAMIDEAAELPAGFGPMILEEPVAVEEIVLTEPEISIPAAEEVILEEPPVKKSRSWRKKNSTV